MKKSIIALAVAGALTAPVIAQADATLYGVAQYRGIKTDTDSFQNKMAKTRLGVKGTVDNDIEGLTTGFQVEWEFAGNAQGTGGDVNMRKSLVYLKGNFGNVVAGSQNSPTAVAHGMTDILGNDSCAFCLQGDRVSQALAYVSPSFGGLTLTGAFVADGAPEASSDDVDATMFAVDFEGAGFGAHASVVDYDQGAVGDTETITSLGVNYTGVENVYLAASIESEEQFGNSVEPETTTLAASYTMGKTTLSAIYSMQDPDTGADDSEQVMVGVRYSLGAKASVGLDYADYNDEAGDNDTVVVEYTLSF